jgi:hypothetical protein
MHHPLRVLRPLLLLHRLFLPPLLRRLLRVLHSP